MRNHAKFDIIENTNISLLIKDIGNHTQNLTITNDVEYVINDLFKSKKLKINQKLFYIDSDNIKSEIIWEPVPFGIKFIKFKPIIV